MLLKEEKNMIDHHDNSHLEQLSQHLWQWPESRASVLVGSGISKNAIPIQGGQNSFPNWWELSQSMIEELYPDTPTQDSSSKSPTRIASEYASRFGESKLEDFLRKTIPDDTHKPGEIHKLLLQLPWGDVFTTNYDTLLERTEVAERSYRHITKMDDLKGSIPPRIIKLHGSFPCQTPFIITQRHYNRYDDNFAFFVNTIRQSLIQTSLVLLGFSGEDPNFIKWADWIQGLSNDSHLPIYMISSSSLKDAERSHFLDMGITPIDLNRVPNIVGSSSWSHAKKLESFLQHLLDDRPPRPERWPGSVSSTSTPADYRSGILEVFLRWRSERLKYPGWIVPPNDVRREMLADLTRNYAGVMKSIIDWTPVERALVFREILWRFDMSMIPLDSSLLDSLDTTMRILLPIAQGAAPAELSNRLGRLPEDSQLELLQVWTEIALALLRDAREAYDSDRWNEIRDLIEMTSSDHILSSDQFIYEQALWYTWNLEREKTKELLKTWHPSIHSSQAVLWKAGLLADLDDLEKAYPLFHHLLATIRTTLSRATEQNIELLSCKGWCTLFLHYFHSISLATDTIQQIQSSLQSSGVAYNSENYLELWDKLRESGCDPWSTIEHFDKVLSDEPPFSKSGRKVVYGFDPGRRSVSHTLGLNPNTQWLPAFSYIRMFEKTGLPLRFSNDTLKNASKWLSPHVDFWSPLLLLLAGKTRAFAEHMSMSRTRMADMDDDRASKLYRWAMDALNREMSYVTDQIPFMSHHTSLIESLIELLSRLALKSNANELDESFCRALELHGQWQFYSHIRLHEACRPWFKRLFNAADDTQLLAWLPRLLRFPLVRIAVQNQNPDIFTWPDSVLDFPVGRLLPPNDPSPHKLIETRCAIDHLLENTRVETEEDRQRLLKRLIRVSDLMSPTQQQELGSLLWEHTNTNRLPDIDDVYSFVYLHIPSPANTDPLSIAKEYLLSLAPRRSYSSSSTTNQVSFDLLPSDNMLYDVSHSTKLIIPIPHELNGKIQWTKEEAQLLWIRVLDWWENDRYALAIEGSSMSWGADYLFSKFEGLNPFLYRVVLPYIQFENDEEFGKLLAFLTETRQYNIFLTTAHPYLLLHPYGNPDKVKQTILNDLSSQDEMAIRNSSAAIRHWIHLSNNNRVILPSNDILTKLIRRIAFQQLQGADSCLITLSQLLREFPLHFCQNDIDLIVASLEPWNNITRTPVGENAEGPPEEERPSLRLCLGRLTSALIDWLTKHNAPYTEPHEITLLRDLLQSDPLPEVRRSLAP